MIGQYTRYPALAAGTWKASVDTAADLPSTGNTVGDARVAEDMGFIYVWNGSSWINNGGSGTVTSVALSAPASILTVSGSPITGAGTLTLTLATQTANTVFAGPASGGAAQPTFRALVAADFPAAVGGYITSLTGDVTATGPGAAAATIANLAVTNAKIANATIDLTTKVTGALPIANGGTGQTTANAAFGALSPMTTNGDLITRTAGVPARLAIGTAGQVLTVVSGAPAWATPSPYSVSSINSNTSAVAGVIYLCDTSGGAFNVTLPVPVSGIIIIIKDKTGSFQTNNLTIVQHAAEKIEGLAASKVLQTNWGSFSFFSDGTDWYMGPF